MSWQIEAHLFGGRGDGLLVRVEQLDPQITVFRNGGPPFAMPGAVEASVRPDAMRMGVYDLVGRAGPDTPTYVAV